MGWRGNLRPSQTVSVIVGAGGRGTACSRTFKQSTDPAFAEKVEDVVGLYVDPPRHAVLLSIDEKSCR